MQAKSLLNNSLANLLRAGSASAVSVIIPLVLAWRLPHDQYVLWSLLFGIAAYVLFLDFGLAATLQVAAAKLTASPAANSPRALIRRILLLAGVLVLAIQISAALLGFVATSIFADLPKEYLLVFGVALFLVCFGQCASLIANILTGYYMASHRTMKPTLALLFSRIVAVGGVSIVSFITDDLLFIALAFSAPLALGCALVILALVREVGRFIPMDRPTRRADSKWTIRRILSFSMPLALWNLTLLVITGSGVWIVGQTDYQSLGAYSIATMLVTIVLGLENAILGPLLSELSHKVAQGDGLARYIMKVSTLNSVFVMSVGIVIFACFVVFQPFLPPSINHYLSPGIVGLLLLGNAIRLSLAPLSLAFVANGSHKRLVIPPLVETLIYFAALNALGTGLGLFGISIGTVVGATIGSGIKLLWSLKIAAIPSLGAVKLAWKCIAVPVLCAAPIVIISTAMHGIGASRAEYMPWTIVACCLALLFLVVLCITSDDRVKLKMRIASLRSAT